MRCDGGIRRGAPQGLAACGHARLLPPRPHRGGRRRHRLLWPPSGAPGRPRVGVYGRVGGGGGGGGENHFGVLLADTIRVLAQGALVPPLLPSPGTTGALDWARGRPPRLPCRDGGVP